MCGGWVGEQLKGIGIGDGDWDAFGDTTDSLNDYGSNTSQTLQPIVHNSWKYTIPAIGAAIATYGVGSLAGGALGATAAVPATATTAGTAAVPATIGGSSMLGGAAAGAAGGLAGGLVSGVPGYAKTGDAKNFLYSGGIGAATGGLMGGYSGYGALAREASQNTALQTEQAMRDYAMQTAMEGGYSAAEQNAAVNLAMNPPSQFGMMGDSWNSMPEESQGFLKDLAGTGVKAFANSALNTYLNSRFLPDAVMQNPTLWNRNDFSGVNTQTLDSQNIADALKQPLSKTPWTQGGQPEIPLVTDKMTPNDKYPVYTLAEQKRQEEEEKLKSKDYLANLRNIPRDYMDSYLA